MQNLLCGNQISIGDDDDDTFDSVTKAAKRRRLNERADTLLKELKVETAEGFVLICINWNSAAT